LSPEVLIFDDLIENFKQVQFAQSYLIVLGRDD